MKRIALAFSSLAMVGMLLYWMIPTSYAQKQAEGLPGVGVELDAGEYPSLQAAIDALPIEGGVVRIPPGRFRIHQPLRISQDDVALIGSGSATWIVNANLDRLPAIVLEHPRRPRFMASGEMLWRIQLKDFRVTGNPRSGTGIVATGIQELQLDGVTVSHHGQDGVTMTDCKQAPRVTNCLIAHNKTTGLNLTLCHDAIVSSNQFLDNSEALKCSSCDGLCITGNTLNDHHRRCVEIHRTTGTVLSGNIIDNCSGAAVLLDSNSYGITVSSNSICNNGRGVQLARASGCTISANSFSFNQGHSVFVSELSSRISVCANSFSNRYRDVGRIINAADEHSAGGLTLQGTDHIAVSGNMFADLTPSPGIHFSGDKRGRTTLSGNVTTDNIRPLRDINAVPK